jgi:hypothetical protein
MSMEVEFPWTQSSSRLSKEKTRWSTLHRELQRSSQGTHNNHPQSSPSGPHTEKDRVDGAKGDGAKDNGAKGNGAKSGPNGDGPKDDFPTLDRTIRSAPNIAETKVDHVQILGLMSRVHSYFEIAHEVRAPPSFPPCGKSPSLRAFTCSV